MKVQTKKPYDHEVLPVIFEGKNILKALDKLRDQGVSLVAIEVNSGASARTIKNLRKGEPQFQAQPLARLANYLGFDMVIGFRKRKKK